jgi:hypothetical protein
MRCISVDIDARIVLNNWDGSLAAMTANMITQAIVLMMGTFLS